MWRSKARAFLLPRSLLRAPPPALQDFPARTVSSSPPLLPFPPFRVSPPGLHYGNRRFLSVRSNATAVGFSQERALDEKDVSVKEPSIFTSDASWSTVSDDKRVLSAGKDDACSMFDDLTDKAGSPLVSADGLELSTGGLEQNAAFGEVVEWMEEECVVGGNDDACGPENDYDSGTYDWEEHQGGAAGTMEVDMEKVQNVVFTLQNALPEVLESTLDEMDLELNEEFVLSVLQAVSASSFGNLVAFLRYATRSNFVMSTTTVLEFFVEKMHGFCNLNRNDAFMLWDLVRDVGEKQEGSLNTSILNHIISIFSKLGNGKSVVEVFNMYNKFGCLPDGDTYYNTILALGKPSWADTALIVYEKMIVSGEFPDEKKVGKIVKFFCKGGKLKEAHRVYVTAKDMGKCPPTQYLNMLLHNLSNKDDTLPTVLEILEHLPKEKLNEAGNSFVSAISGLCRIKNTEEAKNLLQKMIETGPPPSNVVFNHVITALCKADEIHDAVSVLKKMKNMKLKPDIRAYNVIMAVFCKGGMMEDAQEIFDEAKKMHKKLGRVSYHILSRGYCRINDFESAINWMRKMKEEGLAPNVDDYRKMIQTLCLNSMDWGTAELLLQEMNDSGLSLDGQTRGLIFAVKQLEQEEMRSVGLVTLVHQA